MIHISLITIGNELLKGRVINTNATYAAQIMRENGYHFSRVVTIADTREEIVETLEEELAHSDVVVMCGGLGPTSDDITKKTLADLFGMELAAHEPTVQFLKERFARRDRNLSERNMHQAYVPVGCEVLPNSKGTAPGMHFEREGKHIYSLPGVPFEMLHLIEYGVLPSIQKYFPIGAFEQRVIRISHVSEARAADRMMAIEEMMPDGMELSYLPKSDSLWLELTMSGIVEDKERLIQHLEEVEAFIMDEFKEEFVTLGSLPLEQEIGVICKEKGLTIGVAESMTGGAVGASLVRISGSSSYFKGSMVVYATSAKISVLGMDPALIEKHTVYSEEVACAMAEAVREKLGTDIGLATTGMAEMTASEKAEGKLPFAWIAYADKDGSEGIYLKTQHSRKINIEKVSNAVLRLCLRKIRILP